MSAVADCLRLALIDSRPLVRAAVGYLLETSLPRHLSAGFLVQPFASPAEFLAQCRTPSSEVDVVVFNIGAAFTRDRPIQEDVRRLRDGRSDLPLVLLCDHADACHGLDAIRLGINGYIPTMLSPALAVQAIRLVHAGGTFVPINVVMGSLEGGRSSLAAPGDGVNLDAFTRREREVLRLMWQGKSNKVIALRLEVSESTVKVYVRQIMKKLGASNRTHAIFLLSQSVSQVDTD